MHTYLELLEDIITYGESCEDRTGVGTISMFGYQWQHDMDEGFPLLTTKKVPLRWVAEELFWFLSGSTNEQDLRARGVDIWKEWATAEQCAKFNRSEGDLGPVYGWLWRNWGIDQVATLLDEAKTNPDSRRLIVSGWNPETCNQVALPPCHTLWQIKINKGHISLSLYARSIDAFLGLPFNIASYGLLLLLLGRTLRLRPQRLIISFGDLHIYKNHINQVETQLNRRPYDLPHVNILNYREKLEHYTWSDIELIDYDCHPKIEAPVAI